MTVNEAIVAWDTIMQEDLADSHELYKQFLDFNKANRDITFVITESYRLGYLKGITV